MGREGGEVGAKRGMREGGEDEQRPMVRSTREEEGGESLLERGEKGIRQ